MPKHLHSFSLTLLLITFSLPKAEMLTYRDTIVLATCESGTSRNILGANWYWYTDKKYGGSSTILNQEAEYDSVLNIFNEFVPAKGEGNDSGTSGYGAHLIVNLDCDGSNPPYGGVGFELCDTGSTFDLSGMNSIIFWARSTTTSPDVYFEFLLLTADVEDYGFYRYELTLSNEWKRYSIDFNDFYQPDWSDPAPFDPSQMQRISFHASSYDCDTVEFWLDDIIACNFDPVSIQSVAHLSPAENRSVFSLRLYHNNLIMQIPGADTYSRFNLFTLSGQKSYTCQIAPCFRPRKQIITLPELVHGRYIAKLINPDFIFTAPILIYR